jgi:hypothetical protein
MRTQQLIQTLQRLFPLPPVTIPYHSLHSARPSPFHTPVSLQYAAPPVAEQRDEVDGGGGADDAAGDLPEDALGGGRVERDGDVHAEDARDRDGAADHQRARRQHDPHLQQLVLLVVQHDVDVVLRVVHVLAQLHQFGTHRSVRRDRCMAISFSNFVRQRERSRDGRTVESLFRVPSICTK